MSNYYTPSIKEFHVGFEYQEKITKGAEETWVSHTCMEWNIGSVIEDLYTSEDYSEKIRVKCIDKEDIESLCWKFIGKLHNCECMQFERGDFYMEFWYNVNKFVIKSTSSEIFNVTIKNKTELSKLMLMLDITHE